jgi:hypothetical protein
MWKLLMLAVLLQPGKAQTGRFENGLYSTCPDKVEIRGFEDMFTSVEENELVRLAQSKPVAKCPINHCGSQVVPVDISIHEGKVVCVNAKGGAAELQKAAVDTAMQMKFKKVNAKPFYGITGTLNIRFKN